MFFHWLQFSLLLLQTFTLKEKCGEMNADDIDEISYTDNDLVDAMYGVLLIFSQQSNDLV